MTDEKIIRFQDIQFETRAVPINPPEPVTCPACGFVGPNEAAIRQGPRTVDGFTYHEIQVGFRCTKCRNEWGFLGEDKMTSD